MTMTKYVPTWERNYDRWETEPDTTLDFDMVEDEEMEIEDFEISEDEFDEEFDLDKWEEMR